jgi:hypothetical protein
MSMDRTIRSPGLMLEKPFSTDTSLGAILLRERFNHVLWSDCAIIFEESILALVARGIINGTLPVSKCDRLEAMSGLIVQLNLE